MTNLSFYTAAELPLKSLEVHPRNVRAGNEEGYGAAAVARLAANILEVGLLQPLLVQGVGKNRYGVLAGGRRLAALKSLAAERSAKGFSGGTKAPCRLVPEDAPVTAALSLSENEMQLPMDAIDRYEAFVALRQSDGLGIGDIARLFGQSERSVRETLRIGQVAEGIRAAHRAGDLSLETLKSFARHPDPAVQQEVFTALSADGRRVEAWQVRRALDERGVRQGDALGAFVLDAYRAAGGAVAADLIEEDSVLSDPGLVQTVLARKLDDLAGEERTRLGFAWAEYRVDPDWNAFEAHGRVHPQPVEPDARTQAKVDALGARLDELTGAHEAAEDETEQERLSDEYEAVSAEIEALTTAYVESDRARAGVIVVWQHGGVRCLCGLVRPGDMPSKSPAGLPEPDGDDTAAGPKMSGKLLADLAKERTRAVGLALARDAQTARLHGDWLIVQNVLPGVAFGACRSSLRFTAATFAPALMHECGTPEEIATRFGAVERDLAAHEADLPLEWVKAGYAGFAALDEAVRARLVAWAVSRTLEPVMAEGLRGDEARASVEASVLPDLRAVWTPDARLFGRLTKPDLLRILRDDLGLGQKADALAKAKKSEIVEKVSVVFAAPAATLTEAQRQAIARWRPPGMQTVLPEPVEEAGEAGTPDAAALAA